MYLVTPPPETFGSFRAGDMDTRDRDYTDDLQPLADTVKSATVVITRQDGAARGPSDLAVSGAAMIDPTGLIVTWWLTGGIAGSTYIVTVTAVTAAGRTLVRDGIITVVAALG